MTLILRRSVGVVLILAGLAGLLVGGWFARAMGSDGAATFTAVPEAGMPLVIGPDTNARTDIPLTIVVTADAGVPVTVSIATPSDAQTLLGDSRHTRVTGVDVREWALRSATTGTEEPIAPATADLWRSQVTTNGGARVAADLEEAPETMIITTPEGTSLTSVQMTWAHAAWFYQALSVAVAGLLALLVGVALMRRGPAEAREAAVSR